VKAAVVPPALAVVIVTHNTRDDTLRCLESLAGDPERSAWEVVVVDNASTDRTQSAIRERHPWVRVISNDPQPGFAAAVNQGVALTTAPTIVTVNPDALVPVGALSRLGAVLQRHSEVAGVGPLIRFPSGAIQRHGMFTPRPYTAIVILLGLSRLPLFRREANRYYGVHLRGAPTAVDQLTGACLMFRREAFTAVGPFDARFFLYCEDVDWCLRARKAGWKLLFVPEVEITHSKGAASRTHSAWAIRTYYRSLRAFYAKHHASSTHRVIRGLWYAGAYLQEVRALAVDAVGRKGLRY
jgi:N-acetylglucosaminyl-diphospho-decaprenol L-rhamnosyltransferase